MLEATGESRRITLRVDDAALPGDPLGAGRGDPGRAPHRPVGDDPATWRRELLEHVAAGQPGSARALARRPRPDGGVVERGRPRRRR